ncbi:hypothetical protein Tco_1284742 [Tanacetum coccineum]
MPALVSCHKHNMVACLEKTERNAQFHEIVDFLTRSSIYYSLTASPTVSTSLIEQFWNIAISKIVNDVSYIKDKVAGKTVLDLQKAKDAQAAEIFKLKKRIKKLEKKLGNKEFVSKQGRKNPKSKPTLDAFDDLDADLAHGMDYMETKEAVNKGRKSNETKELNLDVDTEVRVSTVSTARLDIDTARPEVHTANAPVSTAGVTISTVDPRVSVVELRTPLTTTSIFDDEDITMAQTLIKMKEEKAKEKPVKIKRKDQGIDQIEKDEELAHKLHKEELAEIARIQEEKAAQEEASRVAIMEMFDEVQIGIDDDALFASKLQQEKREEYTIEERAKFLAETIVAQRKFKATQRAAEIRSRPPTKAQLRNLMMTYLKNMGGYKHSQLKPNTFEEIQGMYERQKKKIDDFKPMDSDDAVKDIKLEEAEQGTKKTPGKIVKMKARKNARKQTHADTNNEHDYEEDERKIESMNKEDAGESNEKVSDVSKKRKEGPRMKRMSKRKKTEFGLKEEEDLKTFLKIVPDKEGIIDYEVLKKRFPIINWESKFYHYERHGAKGIYYMIFRSDGSSRWIKTFSEMVTRFDKLDLVELYNLVMQWFETITLEGVNLVLWGDLRTMFDANTEDELWQNQERWNLKSWNFYKNCEVHTLTLEDGNKIHMLVERKYPLTKETLERMMSLKLIAKSASDGAYDLLRFIQKHQELASSEQTAFELASPKQMDLGKDFLNLLIVDSLLKTIWLSMHHVVTMKHWLFQSKQLLLSYESSSAFEEFLKVSYGHDDSSSSLSEVKLSSSLDSFLAFKAIDLLCSLLLLTVLESFLITSS